MKTILTALLAVLLLCALHCAADAEGDGGDFIEKNVKCQARDNEGHFTIAGEDNNSPGDNPVTGTFGTTDDVTMHSQEEANTDFTSTLRKQHPNWWVDVTGGLRDPTKPGRMTITVPVKDIDENVTLYVFHVTINPKTELTIKPAMQIGIPTFKGETYRLLWSDKPDGTWSPLGAPMNGTDLVEFWFDVGDVDRPPIADTRKRFYRVEVTSVVTKTDLRVEFGNWMSRSTLCDPNSVIPITVYNDGTPVVKCVNVEVYHVPWNVCCNDYYWYWLWPRRLAKLTIERIQPNGSVTLDIPWHPEQNCNSLKVRVDPDDTYIDRFGAPIPPFWQNPAYPNGHILELDDGEITNNNWDCSAGNIPTLRPCQ